MRLWRVVLVTANRRGSISPRPTQGDPLVPRPPPAGDGRGLIEATSNVSRGSAEACGESAVGATADCRNKARSVSEFRLQAITSLTFRASIDGFVENCSPESSL